MRKYLSSDFSFCVIPTMAPIALSSRFSCSIPWSGPVDVNPATLLVTQKLPFLNSGSQDVAVLSVALLKCTVVEGVHNLNDHGQRSTSLVIPDAACAATGRVVW